MKKIFFSSLALASLALCVLLAGIGFGAGNTKNSFPESEERARARAAAERAGIDYEKNPAALITKEDLQDGVRTTVIGMLREVGTAHFPSLVITPLANFDIRLLGIEKSNIPNYSNLYNKYVEVTGIIAIRVVHFGTNQRERYSITANRAPRLIR